MEKEIYVRWISLEEAKIFAERNNITLEEEIKALEAMGFTVIDFKKHI